MPKIADVAVPDTDFGRNAAAAVAAAETSEDMQVLRKLVNDRGNELKLADLQAKLGKKS